MDEPLRKSCGTRNLIRPDSRAYLVVGRNWCSYMLRRKARISSLYSTRHVAGIFHECFNNKGLYMGHIPGCNYVIKAYSKIVCHAMLNFTTL